MPKQGPETKSNLEAELDFLLKRLGYPKPEEEYRFHPERRFRADRAYPQKKILIEVEGGIYSRGRHTRPEGYTNDCCKYNLAAILGYIVLRFTGGMLRDGTAEDHLLLAWNVTHNTNP